jgi:hypothetical protein
LQHFAEHGAAIHHAAFQWLCSILLQQLLLAARLLVFYATENIVVQTAAFFCN